MPPKPPTGYVGASLQALKSYLRRNRDAFPVEGVVLDFWKLDKSCLPSCPVTVGPRQAHCRASSAMGPRQEISQFLAGGEPSQRGALRASRPTLTGALCSRRGIKVAGSKACGKSSQDKIGPLLRSGGVGGKLSGIDATVAGVFRSARPETECGRIFVTSYDDMSSLQAGVFALEATKGERVRHRNAWTASEMRRLSEVIWKYARQAEPARLGAVAHARATVEVVCHAGI